MKKSVKLGMFFAALIIVVSLIGHFWTPYSVTQMNASLKNAAPSWQHIMGCDNFGRDIFSRVLNGMGTTVLVAVLTVGAGLIFGTVIGALCGYYDGIVDQIVMRICDVILAFPSVLLVLVFIALTGTGKYNIIYALGFMFIPSFVRIARGEMLKLKEMEYIKSAKVMGVSDMRIIFSHVIPNMRSSLLTSLVVGFNNAVLAEASMSYLGLGVQPPDASLGRMISEAQSYIFRAPWYPIFPGIVIIIIILTFSMLGEELREAENGS
ncbi:MAG: ABC transporter permease [Lachnospiraceae bacterium]|nr:ABC transporter permease [Lachnospiraceae bacterium]